MLERIDQSPKNSLNKLKIRRLCLGLLGVALLASLTLASAAGLNYLAPKATDRMPGLASRMDWYLHHGQLQADLRTLSASCRYLMSSDDDTPAVTNWTEVPVADNTTKRAPQS